MVSVPELMQQLLALFTLHRQALGRGTVVVNYLEAQFPLTRRDTQVRAITAHGGDRLHCLAGWDYESFDVTR